MSSHAYQPLPTSPPPSGLVNAEAEEFDRLPETVNTGETDENAVNDDDRLTDPTSFRPLRESVESEFARPPPSWWKRLLLVLFVLFTGWAAVRLGSSQRKPKVIYASRYSEEHKYRPAASPVITEHLQDGRIRLRGASVGGVGVKEEDIPLTPKLGKLQS
ncbi:hypothetical protein TREMEDRAFT_60698 [Tremella mesenterica DSM 1558]|uniref:uncharacterized protein n=1 Tax=Tremella mesenterica (strain ATCC 24925 / CBS 8224 / DSM 1558 / NBRC 9311 / NRRL Y-6157 / RJB 2259-6 / UBC 559-6) TaxID=578456 RepID=UPI0003F4962B|nr:uncharacterized protein TREMEDRAFT_60698 [Tremella mesenterica DSM 1558]EIW71783.1 hypothetical protein TREMEDRAFT_60698 [Tremella mesenterica DSM 1558]